MVKGMTREGEVISGFEPLFPNSSRHQILKNINTSFGTVARFPALNSKIKYSNYELKTLLGSNTATISQIAFRNTTWANSETKKIEWLYISNYRIVWFFLSHHVQVDYTTIPVKKTFSKREKSITNKEIFFPSLVKEQD